MQATETKAIIPVELMEQVEKLLSGAEIVKIENDLQLESIVSLGKQVKAVRIETEKQGKTSVDPLYKAYKEAQAFVAQKVDALKTLEKNISAVTGTYQWEKQEAARKEQERLIEEHRQKQIALADQQNQRIADEEALRLEAAEKLNSADEVLAEMDKIKELAESKKKELDELSVVTTADADKQGAEMIVLKREIDSLRTTYSQLQNRRNALLDQANTATSVADTAMQEAIALETEIQESTPDVVVPVSSPRGLSVKKKLVAQVTDYRAAMKWIVEHNEWGLVEGAAFKNLIVSAATKYSGNIADKSAFKMAGALCKEVVAGWF